MHRKPLSWALALLVLLWPSLAMAQHIRPQLVAESAAPAPGRPVTLALVMSPEPGWHGYWLNPGDAGVPLSIKWALPSGAEVGAFRYPVPSTLLIAGLMNHVYERDYALLTTLTLPASARAGDRVRIAGEAEWLACTDAICVPERGAVSIDLTVGDGRIAPNARARFDAWRRALPRPLGSPAQFERRGEQLRIAVPLPESVAAADPFFFAETAQALDYAAPQSVTRTGDTLVIETRATGAPSRLAGVLRLGDGTGLALEAVPGPVPAAGEPAGSGWSALGMLGVLGAALLGGLLLNVMPCVFPILSLKALSLARSGESDRAARHEGLAYTAGVVLACLGLGGGLLALRATGEMVGWAFQLQQPAIVLALLLLMVAITLNLLGAFELPGFGGGGRLASGSAFWTGALAAFVATPCTGPFMGAALGAALVVPTAVGLGIFAMLGLGLALPFLALAWLPALRTRLPRPGPWMATFRRVLAVPTALTAFALLWVLWRQTGETGLAIGLGVSVLLGLALWLAGRAGQALLAPVAAVGALIAVPALAAGPLSRAAAEPKTTLAGSAFSEQRLAQLRAERRPVFVYFTADWCLTCKVNERVAIGSDAVEEAFEDKRVAVLAGDWTNGDPAIGRVLERHGRSGVPLYLYYRPGSARPEVLPQVLTPSMLVRLAS